MNSPTIEPDASPPHRPEEGQPGVAIPADFHVEVCDWRNAMDRDALLAVRASVFIEEQHVPPDLERDDDDARALHVLARALDGAAIGTGRLLVEGGPGDDAYAATGRIGRMAVLPDWRRRGVGASLLHALLDLARDRALARICLHAQRDAVAFYRRFGFETLGDEFVEAGIPHISMWRALELPPPPDRPLPPTAPQCIALHSDTQEEFIAITRTLLAGARHGLCILVRELNPQVFNDTACLVELRRIAISGRGASVRIIAQDLSRVLKEGARLIELVQRLPSVITLRRPLEADDLVYPSAFMCVDTQGFLFRPLEQEMRATGSTFAPGRHAELMQRFEDVWNRSETWSELRPLDI